MTVNLQAPREVLGTTLAELADRDDSIVVLDADLARSTRADAFEARHPNRFLQMGVAEQNAVGVASGLAYAGMRPVFVSMAMFATGLPWTQLRMAAYAGLPVVVLGSHPGLDIGPDGGTHQMLEDIALMRAIPEFSVLVPSDSEETAQAIEWALNSPGPVYVRVGRQPVQQLPHDGPYEPGKLEIVNDQGTDLVIVAEGSMVSIADQVTNDLAREGIKAKAVNIRSIKPLDEVGLRRLANETDLIVTLENHSVIGGLGAAVAEALGGGTRIVRIGTDDRFGSSASSDELRAEFGLDQAGVLGTIKAHLDPA